MRLGNKLYAVSENIQSLSNSDLESTSVLKLEENRHAYRACLIEAYIAKNIEYEKINSGRVSSEVVKSSCSQYRDEYYKSVWASSYPLSNLDVLEFRHNTATTVLRQTDNEMFEFLQNKFPKSQTVTQQYVDDVRGAQ